MCCNGGSSDGGDGGDGGCDGGSSRLAFLETRLVYFIFILFFPRLYTCYDTLLGFFFFLTSRSHKLDRPSSV